VYGWVGGKHACVDVTEVLPLVGLRVGPFTVGHTTIKYASSKMVKHEKTCSDIQHAFIPFAFDTYGFSTPEVVDLLHRVQRIIHYNIMTPRSMNVVSMTPRSLIYKMNENILFSKRKTLYYLIIFIIVDVFSLKIKVFNICNLKVELSYLYNLRDRNEIKKA